MSAGTLNNSARFLLVILQFGGIPKIMCFALYKMDFSNIVLITVQLSEVALLQNRQTVLLLQIFAGAQEKLQVVDET